MGSTRYPGKPLIEIEGLSMIEHVRRRTLLCDYFKEVVVATCDQEIFDVVTTSDGNVVMTSSDHIMASDRVSEVAASLDCTHIVNVQGDEILVLPEDLDLMANTIKNLPDNKYWNAISKIKHENEISDLSIVKCAVNAHDKIMYCARDFSSLNLGKLFNPVRKVLGILGYSRDALLSYSSLPRTPLEISQSIDQSRIIENGFDLCSVTFSDGYPGINEPREVEIVKEILKTNPRQKEILKQILYKL